MWCLRHLHILICASWSSSVRTIQNRSPRLKGKIEHEKTMVKKPKLISIVYASSLNKCVYTQGFFQHHMSSGHPRCSEIVALDGQFKPLGMHCVHIFRWETCGLRSPIQCKTHTNKLRQYKKEIIKAKKTTTEKPPKGSKPPPSKSGQPKAKAASTKAKAKGKRKASDPKPNKAEDPTGEPDKDSEVAPAKRTRRRKKGQEQ